MTADLKPDLRAEALAVIRQLLDHLPDSRKSGNECWSWAWDELNEEAQEAVKAARATACALAARLAAPPAEEVARMAQRIKTLEDEAARLIKFEPTDEAVARELEALWQQDDPAAYRMQSAIDTVRAVTAARERARRKEER